MYAFEVFGFNAVPGKIVVFIQLDGDTAHDVFDEFGIFVSFFGHVFFIHAFQQRIYLSAGGIFHNLYQVFNPEEFFKAHFCRHDAALIMSAEFADFP